MSMSATAVAKPGTSAQGVDLDKTPKSDTPLCAFTDFLDYQEEWTSQVITKVKASRSTDTAQKSNGKGYDCVHCGLQLASEQGLEQHMQRRSIEVRLPCIKCNIVHICYNPCAVLNVMKLCESEVPWGVHVDECKPSISGLPINLKEPDAEAPSSGRFTAEELIRATRTCHECRVFCAEDSLETHMTFPTGLKLTCQACGQRLPTKCSQSAHWRLHKLTPPFVCPECGKLAPRDTKPDEFRHHVNELCHHRERILVYQCPICPAVLLTDRELASHIADAHVQMLYKCSLCSLAFRDTTAFINHSTKTHPYSSATPISVIKCPMCEACVFADTEMLISHFSSIHISSCAKFVFRCHICRALRTDQLAIHEHHKAEHSWQPLFRDVMAGEHAPGFSQPALNLGQTTAIAMDDKSSKSASSSRKRSAYTLTQGVLLRCIKCAFESTNRMQFLSHISSHKEAETSFMCSECGMYVSSEALLVTHLTAVHQITDVVEHRRLVAELVALIANAKKEDQSCPASATNLTTSPAAVAGCSLQASSKAAGKVVVMEKSPTAAGDRKPARPKCTVCNLICADAKALEFHMRTHGMAFLKSFQKGRKC